MVRGSYEGKGIDDPEIRALFEKDHILSSDWYRDRLLNKQRVDVLLMERKIEELETLIADPINGSLIEDFGYADRLEEARKTLDDYRSEAYLASLVGTVGADDLTRVRTSG
jgi:hypothetical protein